MSPTQNLEQGCGSARNKHTPQTLEHAAEVTR